MGGQSCNVDGGWTIGRLINWTADYLSGQNIDEGRLSAEILLAKAIDCRRIDLYSCFDDEPPAEVIARFREWVKRAGNNEPIAYLVGEKEFFSLALMVTPDVLIPRPETETLVEWVLDDCRTLGKPAPKVLDIGTGSGCIAVALLVNLSGAHVVGVDLSASALEIAGSNAERHKVADRFTPVEADCLDVPPAAVPAGGFDVIVSNPPYVASDEMDTLDATVREFEPRGALTDESNGLSFYEAFARGAGELLASEGRMYLEIGEGQGEAILAAMRAAGGWTHLGTRRDRVVGHDRVMAFCCAANDSGVDSSA